MRRLCSLALLLAAPGCAPGAPPDVACGPELEFVDRAIDGDTIELASGDWVRYLLVDAPEIGQAEECYGARSAAFNASLVEGSLIRLEYDAECRDDYGRLLAYVRAGDAYELDVSALLVELGYACVFHIPPNGADRVDWLRELERRARAARRGLWAACGAAVCG
jgi:micrococcal nuclease